MNKIIAKKLDEQLRVLSIFLKEYKDSLNNDILGDTKRSYLENCVLNTRSSIYHYFSNK